MPVPDPDAIKKLLDLAPHPEEGGFFKETYRAPLVLAADALPEAYAGRRAASTAIYYMLTPGTFSELHKLPTDEVFHFYMGDPVEQLQLAPDGGARTVVLGTDLAAGQRPQVVVPGGVWQGARLARGGRFALLGCTVAPGFEYADYTRATRTELLAGWPSARAMIEALTHR